MKIARVAPALFALALLALAIGPRPARAGGCKSNGTVCSTDVSCCSRDCAKPIVKKSARPGLFGLCCPAGSNVLCGGTTCVNTRMDSNNCGGCGKVCLAGESCSGGRCICADGKAICGNACVDKQTDPGNCGSCGTVCPLDKSCTSGRCR